MIRCTINQLEQKRSDTIVSAETTFTIYHKLTANSDITNLNTKQYKFPAATTNKNSKKCLKEEKASKSDHRHLCPEQARNMANLINPFTVTKLT